MKDLRMIVLPGAKPKESRMRWMKTAAKFIGILAMIVQCNVGLLMYIVPQETWRIRFIGVCIAISSVLVAIIFVLDILGEKK